jgi:hypothetical protein
MYYILSQISIENFTEGKLMANRFIVLGNDIYVARVTNTKINKAYGPVHIKNPGLLLFLMNWMPVWLLGLVPVGWLFSIPDHRDKSMLLNSQNYRILGNGSGSTHSYLD